MKEYKENKVILSGKDEQEKKLIERLEGSKHFLFHDECGRQTISIDKIINMLKTVTVMLEETIK